MSCCGSSGTKSTGTGEYLRISVRVRCASSVGPSCVETKVSSLAATGDYLLKPATQVTALRNSSFYSVVNPALLGDLDPDRKAEMAAVQAQLSAPDAYLALLPVGLGSYSGEFDRIFTDAFQRIVLRGQDIHQVLEIEGRQMQHVLDEAKAPCWSPDPPSQGTCQVK